MCVHTWEVKLTQVILAVLYLTGKVWNNPRVLQWKTSEIKHRMEYYGVNFKMGKQSPQGNEKSSMISH